jgi:allophanate hydrolase
VAATPAPLGIGTLELAGGERGQGFLWEAQATAGAMDISHFGGWRAYIDSLHQA